MSSASYHEADFWSAVATTWVEMEDHHEQISGQPGRTAMDRLHLRPGHAVLDVGCGTGLTTIEIAKRVAPAGRALGIDIAPEMLEAARRHASEVPGLNIEFRQADAQSDDLGDADYDAAYSRFGVMFFPEPVRAFANIRKAIKPGAPLAFACWPPLAENEFVSVPARAAAAALGVPLPTPGPEEPGPYSLSDPGRVRAILAGAGYQDPKVEAFHDRITTAAADIPRLAWTRMQIGVVRQLLRDVPPSNHERVQAAIEYALRSRVDHDQLELTRSYLVVTASA